MKRQSGFNIYNISGDNSPRYNVKSTLVPCTGTDYVFLYGGFDDNDNLDSNVYLLNLKEKVWEVDDKHAGLYREGHLAVYIGSGNILVFGGIPYDELTDYIPSRSENGVNYRKDSIMLIYNLFDRKWVSAPNFVLESAPSMRSRHACCLSPDGNKMYVSGGLVNSTPLNDLYCYDLLSGVWHGPIEFAARFDHSITVYDGKLFSFGGLDKDMNHVTRSITYFNFSDQSIGEISLLLKPIYNPRLYDSSMIEEEEEEEEEEDYLNEKSINQSIEEPSSFLPNNCEKIYLDSGVNPSLKLDISLPLWGFDNNDRGIAISYHDLNDFQYIPLVNLKNINSNLKLNGLKVINGYAWKHTFVSDNGYLYILGYEKCPASSRRLSVSSNPDESTSVLSNLISVLEIELIGLGIPTELASKGDKKVQNGSLNLINDFKNFLLHEQFTDFEIVTFSDDVMRNKYEDDPDYMASEINEALSNPQFQAHNFKVLKTHKSILLARWPHFQRLISSGMNETMTNRMFIPEPYNSVKALIFYLYSGSIEFESYITPPFSIIDYSSLLILSNLYELPDLRAQTLFQLYKELNTLILNNNTNETDLKIDLILRVWSNAIISNESVFVSKMVEIIKTNWSLITRSQLFTNLSKDLIIKLCQDCSEGVVADSRLSPKSNRNSFDSLNSPPQTPNHLINHNDIRQSHSNSPFLRQVNNELSPSLTDRNISIL